ncbi:DUF4141 domain-containing protein [Proteiniphilum propionicum]|uniref:DUF4141 domain-containing protein n=1 Tax=Proteiniphilum propionicum TaxID=2829812 RepID=UPI001EE9E5FB|nr:DUF4141 domain-containing protein [Proteiniphilum propionicum]ULB35716.1 DUF4141 domain-containing protein [Proteiniphilum propionicum]
MKTKIILLWMGLLLFTAHIKAQWVVTDPTNLVQGIVNSANQIVQTSSTAKNMISNFQETVKIYNQGKEYYDKLKNVHDLVKDARKVQQTVLLIGEISDIYIENFQKMMTDTNYSVDELAAISFGYTKLLEEGADRLKELKNIVTSSNGLSMSDKERMDTIDKVYNEIKNYRNLTVYYTRKNISVSYLRAREKNQTDRVLALYGNANEKYW